MKGYGDYMQNVLVIPVRIPRPLTAEESERVVARKLERLAAKNTPKQRIRTSEAKPTNNGWKA